jgi:hypothetical protein
VRGTDVRFSSQRQMIAGKRESGEKDRTRAAYSGEGGLAPVKVLLVSNGPQVFSLSQRRLERKGCRCYFARSQRELEQLLNQMQFDIVLTTPRIEGGSTDWLGAALSGSRATLFYVFPVEVGCWWVPVLRIGAECVGASALRPSEFSDVLDELIGETRAAVTKRAT